MQILIDLNSKYLFRILNPLDHILHPPPNVVWSNIHISNQFFAAGEKAFLIFLSPESGSLWVFAYCEMHWQCFKPDAWSWKRFCEMVIVGTGPAVYISQKRAQNLTLLSPKSFFFFINQTRIAGGDNWAEKHEKWHRLSQNVQFLPQTEKAQSVTPQTTKYR